MKKAFTLIELLVVIAIIAILAAILFPVFAQAKVAAKKTQDLSNLKQEALATLMYGADNVDIFPLQSGRTPLGEEWYYNGFVMVPSNWWNSANQAYAGEQATGSYVGGALGEGAAFLVAGALGLPQNVILPYQKNLDLFASPTYEKDQQHFAAYGPYQDVATPYAKVTYSMNGLLSSYPSSGVTSPSSAMLWWPGFGSNVYEGFTYTNPFLVCPHPDQPCRFDPNGPVIDPGLAQSGNVCPNHDLQYGPGQSGGLQNGQNSDFGNVGYGTVWMFGKQENWAFSDGHAKSHPMGTGDQKLDPFDVNCYDSAGHPNAANSGCTNAAVFDQVCHIPLFRPDYQP